MPSLVIPQRLQLKGEFSNWSAKPLEGEDRQKEGHKTSLRWWLWSCECTGCSSSSKHWCCHIPSSTPAVPSSTFWRKSHPSVDLWNEEAQCDRMVRSCLLKAAAPAISSVRIRHWALGRACFAGRVLLHTFSSISITLKCQKGEECCSHERCFWTPQEAVINLNYMVGLGIIWSSRLGYAPFVLWLWGAAPA